MSEEIKKDEVKEEKVEEKKEETKEVKEEKCSCGCEDCHDDCDCDDECGIDYSFEPIHKKASCANIFSIICKVVAAIFALVGTYSFGATVVEVVKNKEMYGGIPFAELTLSYCSTILLVAFAFWGIGEIINLINRIKESIMY